ncbi:glycoside hydrolase family 43 protein [Sphingomonas sp. AP4-R1]|uniref:glycoside hydrolase family 43 protein n=1 Tax=Sphingomonas sp. AP4-R1 TaxID=2735134 RepID=UPI0020A4271A|nr:glycoside hydrolase family 43 protein [Sphingomonas sp. AP4-R1]
MTAVVAGLLAVAPASAQLAPAPLAAPLVMTDMHLHDPWIVADEASRTYYLFTRNEAAMTGDRRLGTMVYASRDLKHWTKPRLAFVLPEGRWADAGAWAPEVHRWKGRWYLFTTFHNAKAVIGKAGPRDTYRRGTVLAVSDKVDGPYTLVRGGEPIVPKGQMTLDGSLYVDPKGKPFVVYSHEWWQIVDGTIEAAPLKDDLSIAGPSRVLFKASEGPWVVGQKQPEGDTVFVTDGPELFRTKTGTLLMLWSSYGTKGYVEGQARSTSGGIEGPWEQLGPLVQRDSGHGMLFRTFDGRLMMVLHRPFANALGKLYEMRDEGDRLSVVREATELDGEAYPTHPCVAGHSSFDGATPGC